MARIRAKPGRLIHYTAMTADLPFWKTTKLSQMSRAQWESLCDGCGKCCLNKLIDDDTGELFFTNAACHQLDLRNCRCKDYQNRHKLVPDCVRLTPRNINKIDWLPETCAYRLLRDGEDLPSWHPLVSGDPNTVHKAGISVRGKAINETKAGPLENHIIDWA